MNKYIDTEKLIESVNNYREGAKAALNPIDGDADYYKGKIDACENIQELITSLQQEQPEVDLENYISNKLRELGADLINHKPYSFNRGLNVGKTNAYHDILDRLNARKEE